MQAFSIRPLKSNPSAVLRAAEADAMALVTSHQQPAALVVALDRLGLPNTEAVRSPWTVPPRWRACLALAALPGDPLLPEDPRGGGRVGRAPGGPRQCSSLAQRRPLSREGS
jgi:antitoxin (DNA-binding transcriptional repressor) of toxin-antitoxin stability system